MVAYVVDSNCFIHMGGMASTTILNDLKSALGTMHVTKGVHDEIQNVRYQRWKQKPNLLNHIKPLLTTHEVSEGPTRSHKVSEGPTRSHKASEGLTRSRKVA